MTFKKVCFIVTIVCSSFLAYSGFSGQLSPFIGGLGWALVLLNNIANYIVEKNDEKAVNKIIDMAKEESRKQKIADLSPKK